MEMNDALTARQLGVTDTPSARAYIGQLLAEEGIAAGWQAVKAELCRAYYDGGPVALAGEAEVEVPALVVRLALFDHSTTSIGRSAARRIAAGR